MGLAMEQRVRMGPATHGYIEVPGGAIIQVTSSANGIGDAILGLMVTEGLRRARPECKIVFVVKAHCHEWVSLFNGYDWLALNSMTGVESYDPYSSYGRQLQEKLAKPRWEYYADVCGTTATVPTYRELPAHAVDWARPYAGRVVLSPWSTDKLRTWSLAHWLTLESLLHARGIDTVILDDRLDRARAFRGAKILNEAPVRVGAVIHAALCLVGNDSGMPHVAGMFRTPAIVLCGSMHGSKIFGAYPTVQSLQGELSCSPCYGGAAVAALRNQIGCSEICFSLQAITPATVMAAVEKQIHWNARQHTLLALDRLAVLGRAARETAHLPGSLAELGCYKGGSALMMAQSAPGKLLHLFDTFEGLPSDCPEGIHRKGEFAAETDGVHDLLKGHNVVFHEGFFPTTTVGLEDEAYACVHVDGDLYQTTKDAIEYFWPRLVPNGVMVFDDVDWGHTPGVARALHEAGLYGQLVRTAQHQGRLVKPCPTSPTSPCLSTNCPGPASSLSAI